MQSPAAPSVLLDFFFVTGTNKTHYNGVDLQHSRNMIIIRDENKLSLINTVRLDGSGLATLDALGKVESSVIPVRRSLRFLYRLAVRWGDSRRGMENNRRPTICSAKDMDIQSLGNQSKIVPINEVNKKRKAA